MNKRKKALRVLITIVVVIISLMLIFSKQIRNAVLALNTNSYNIAEVDKNQIKKNKDTNENVSFDFEQVESVSEEALLKAATTDSTLPVIGGIAIPELNLNLPIFKGVTNEALLYGAGTMKETQEMGKGNYSLASHYVSGFNGASGLLFAPLERAQTGMKIYVTDKDKVYTYTITDVYMVDPTAIEVIEDSEGDNIITLVTCNDYSATQRRIVRGVLSEEKSYDETNDSIKNAFEYKYSTYTWW